MLNRFILTKSKYIPIVTSQRNRVRHLPKENYGDNETPYVKSEKPGRSFVTQVLAIAHRKNFTLAEIKNWKKWRKIEDMRENQKFLTERHQILGPNLATAHFICTRGGKVKFKGSNNWITGDDVENERIPNRFVDGYFIEEVDASGTNLCYEGFENLCNLIELKKLFLRNCPFVDDWCLSRSHLFAKSLEHLDISGCQNVTERGICALHPLKSLKTLVLDDTPNLYNRELVTLLLQDVIPKLEIIGVDCNDPIFLKRIENYMIA